MKTLRTILSSLLIMLVLISSISHSLSFHFCDGEIENMALFGTANACLAHNSCNADSNGKHHSMNHNGCCEDKSVALDTDLYLSKITSEIATVQFPDASIQVNYPLHESDIFSRKENINRTIYKPPLIEQDIVILVQTFII